MQLRSDNINMMYGSAKKLAAVSGAKNIQTSDKDTPSLTFTGLQSGINDVSEIVLETGRKKYAEKVMQKGQSTLGEGIKKTVLKAKDGVIKFFKENFLEGKDITYKEKGKTLEFLRANFGETFEDCFLDIDNYNNMISSPKSGKLRDAFHNTFNTTQGRKDKFVYRTNEGSDSITFHKDPFLKNMCLGIKEFTVGQLLDCGVKIRNVYRKANAKFGRSDIISPTTKRGSFINEALDKRILENEARDAFYRLTGVFEKANEGVSNNYSLHQKNAVINKIKTNIEELASGSIGQASKKVGKYNTNTERAWNRLGTGFVSATFAATDFYNISMLQNNDPEKANQSGRKRFRQDMRRQCLTAGITYVVLGALQSSVNSSIMFAALSLGGVTLISEVLSRKIGGIPLKPLNPEEAKKVAEKQEQKYRAKENKNEEAENKETKAPVKISADNGTQDDKSVFNVFTEKLNNNTISNQTAFTSGKINNETENTQTNKNKKSSITSKIIKGFLAIVGLSLGIGYLRTKNIFKSDDIIKSISKKYGNIKERLSSKRLIMSQDDVDGFLDYLKNNNFNKQYKVLDDNLKSLRAGGKLSGQSSVVKKYVPKKELNPNGFYYDLGYVESRGKKAAITVLTYPIDTISKFMGNINTLVRTMLGAKPQKITEQQSIGPRKAAEFVEKYATEYREALIKGDEYNFRKGLENTFTRHFSEANSKHNNTTLAMISRIFVTFITGYFFVNDYRNEVLIESKGKDVERANATAKERVGHKLSNFFLNAMFMQLFNSTFEKIYLGSIGGATAVAMATEFTNETAVRASICTPTSKMTREELIEYENERLNDDGIKGKYYKTFMKLTGKKPLSEKAKG